MNVRDFDRLAAVGHRARELGDFEAASKSFTEALAIWRGRALVDVQTGSLLEVEAHRLEEARLNVLDRRIDADLRLEPAPSLRRLQHAILMSDPRLAEQGWPGWLLLGQ